LRFCRYLRLNRDRLKGDGNTEKDWHDALSTTYTVLLNMCVYGYLRRSESISLWIFSLWIAYVL
jgi:hypothetical protein